MDKTKVVLWGGIGAFLFSTFLGLIVRVSFFLLLLRALGGGVFFAALLWGAFWVIEKFIPELLQPQDATMEQNSRIDLVIPPHNPHDGAVAEEGEIAPSGPAKEFDDFVEEVEETAIPLAEPTLEVNVGGTVAAPVEIGKENQQDSIDDLPDLGSFGDVFGDTSAGDSVGGGSPKAEKLSSHGLPGGEPAAIARAIQTVLKRDKEG